MAACRRLATALLVLAAAVVMASFVMICVRTGTSWPWHVVVHEDGRRTLLLTILYFEHAARELPLDLVLGVAIGGSVFFAWPPVLSDRAGGPGRVVVLACISVAVVAVIVVGTLLDGGVPMLRDNLLQHHTRPGAPLAWGSHWRYHLLERLALILISMGGAGLLRVFTDGPEPRARVGWAIAAGATALYLALTVVFADGAASLAQPFRDPQYLGHQARELATHALVTMPAGWGVALLVGAAGAASTGRSARPSVPRIATVSMAAGVVGGVTGAGVCIAALAVDATSYGQTKDVAMLIFPHVFEHSFTYLIVPLVAALTYVAAATWGGDTPSPSSRVCAGGDGIA